MLGASSLTAAVHSRHSRHSRHRRHRLRRVADAVIMISYVLFYRSCCAPKTLAQSMLPTAHSRGRRARQFGRSNVASCGEKSAPTSCSTPNIAVKPRSHLSAKYQPTLESRPGAPCTFRLRGSRKRSPPCQSRSTNSKKTKKQNMQARHDQRE